MTIQFGTSDWRAVIADEFTFAGVRSFGELINENKIVIGGEESAGLSIKGHYPEKDGILACLLAAEAVAARSASLKEQLKDLYNRVGKLGIGLDWYSSGAGADAIARRQVEGRSWGDWRASC
jgi:phosphomannomutase